MYVWENIASLHLMCVHAGTCVHMLFIQKLFEVYCFDAVNCWKDRKCQKWDTIFATLIMFPCAYTVQYTLNYTVTLKIFPWNVCVIQCME